MSDQEGVVYRTAGVDYDLLDAAKREAMAAALATSALATSRGAQAIDASRGEPAFVIRVGNLQLAVVMECLGTKSVLTRRYQEMAGVDRFNWIGIDTVAAIVNDLCAVGAVPLVVNAYFATGSPEWYSPPSRYSSLVQGWKEGCEEAGAVWGGGETPTLAGIVNDAEIDLAGCAVGVVPAGRTPLTGDMLAAGDEIVFVASTGLHTNGASLARRVADQVGLDLVLPDGTTLGDALLAPSNVYVRLLESVYAADLPLSYASHVTGHGLRKLMRADRDLTYRVTQLLPVPSVFEFLIKELSLPPSEAYATFNMGIGFVLFCPSGVGGHLVEVANEAGYTACIAGSVESGSRQVILDPVSVTFDGDALDLR